MRAARFTITLFAVLACVALLLFFQKRNSKQVQPGQPARAMPEQVPTNTVAVVPTNTVPTTARKLINTIKAADMTADQKAEVAKKFETLYKPVVEKWFAAYENRIPFRLEDLTMDKLNERLGKDASFYLYTFVIDGVTFTIQDSNGKAKVNYLMTKKGAQDLNQIPGGGFVPDLTVPVKTDDVIRMLKADCGVEFKPSEVKIKPTAAACALNGGAFVNLLPTGADPNNGLSSKIDLVFDHDGRLVNYERDPFF